MKKDLFSLTALSSIHFPTYPIPLKPQNNFNLILQLDKVTEQIKFKMFSEWK